MHQLYQAQSSNQTALGSILYKHTQYPTDIITMAVIFYCQYKLSLVNITETMALRNVYLSHETVRRRVETLKNSLDICWVYYEISVLRIQVTFVLFCANVLSL